MPRSRIPARQRARSARATGRSPQTLEEVLLASTRAIIEKIAKEFSKGVHTDAELRAYLRREAFAAARDVAKAMRPATRRRART